MAEKRIFCIEVNGECRNLRIIDEDCEYASAGTYCTAYPHGGWERINPKDCEKCKREKHLEGISRKEAIERMARAICQTDSDSGCDVYCDEKCKCKTWKYSIPHAEAALVALLGKE